MGYLIPTQQNAIDSFLENGFIVVPADDRAALDRIRARVVAATADFLRLPEPANAEDFLDTVGAHVALDDLNDLRLAVIRQLTSDPTFREDYYACGRHMIEAIVGNELAMQRGVGLSIQIPHDVSSLLPLHSDCWSEDSPFEVVLWIPLVHCMRTKSMFLAPPDVHRHWSARMHEFASAEDLFGAMQTEVEYLDIPFGNVLIFTHTLMHGNRVNRETTTRWSLNSRFKGLFTPYSDKRLGEYFEPITVRAATRIGLAYRLPEGFHE